MKERQREYEWASQDNGKKYSPVLFNLIKKTNAYLEKFFHIVYTYDNWYKITSSSFWYVHFNLSRNNSSHQGCWWRKILAEKEEISEKNAKGNTRRLCWKSATRNKHRCSGRFKENTWHLTNTDESTSTMNFPPNKTNLRQLISLKRRNFFISQVLIMFVARNKGCKNSSKKKIQISIKKEKEKQANEALRGAGG